MKTANRHGALAEEAEGDPAVLSVLACEGDAGRYGDVAAHDAVAAEHVVLCVKQVHRAAESLRTSGDFPVELGEDGLGLHPLGYGEAVVAVGSYDVVVGRQRRAGADRDGLLSDVKVQKSTNFTLRVCPRALFLAPADEEHLSVERGEPIRARVGGGGEVGWVGRCKHGCGRRRSIGWFGGVLTHRAERRQHYLALLGAILTTRSTRSRGCSHPARRRGCRDGSNGGRDRRTRRGASWPAHR